MLIVTLGVFILWMGWFAFNGGSQLAIGSAKDAVAMSVVLVNTNLAAAAGVVAALAVSKRLLGRIDLIAGLNGAIAGLVSITAGPDMTEHWWALIIGAVGGILCTAGIRLLEMLKLDDVVGAIPAHLICGIWGTIARLHRLRRQYRYPAARHRVHRRLLVHLLLHRVAPDRGHDGPAGIEEDRGDRPGRR